MRRGGALVSNRTPNSVRQMPRGTINKDAADAVGGGAGVGQNTCASHHGVYSRVPSVGSAASSSVVKTKLHHITYRYYRYLIVSTKDTITWRMSYSGWGHCLTQLFSLCDGTRTHSSVRQQKKQQNKNMELKRQNSACRVLP